MASGGAQLGASDERPLAVRARPDLIIEPQQYQGRRCWILKDPLAQKYYRFEEEEYSLLQMLDGRASLLALREAFHARFAPQRITTTELHQFVGNLHRSGLVVSETPEEGSRLLQRARRRRVEEWKGVCTNLLAIRFKGFDPDRLLERLDRWCGWFFSLPVLLFNVLLMLAAGGLILVQFDAFRARLPAFHEFFAVENWIWFALVLAVTKVLHEFGHGLVCKRLGGECHEMGLMLLVFTPCLYCNVSDAWLLPSRWRRAAVGAAGVYVELALASLCTFLWWFSEPGWFNQLCLAVMFVSSVSTIGFNLNPLLRYDGYYILSDLLEIPNLRQKATRLLQRRCGAWFLGLPEPHDPFLPARNRGLFIFYSVAAALYRWVVVFSILWFLNGLLEPYGLKALSRLLAAAALVSMLGMPLWQFFKFLRTPGRWEAVNKLRAAWSCGAVAGGLALLLAIPLPDHVPCPVRLEPGDAAAVYVEVPGRLLAAHVRPGTPVRRGDLLAEFENLELELEINRLAGERSQLASRLESLRRQAVLEEAAGLEADSVAASLAAVDEVLERRGRERGKLRIVAPRDGVVLAPPRIARREPHDLLPSWSGSPLDPANQTAHFESGVLLCHVGDPRKLEALMLIDQAEVERVAEGQPVRLQFEVRRGKAYDSTLQAVSRRELQFAPRGMSQHEGGPLLTLTDSDGQFRPLTPTYQAAAPLHDDEQRLILGSLGEARIAVGRRALGVKLWNILQRTFHFEL